MSNETKSHKLEQLISTVYSVFGRNAPTDIILIVKDPVQILSEVISKTDPTLVVDGGDKFTGARSFIAEGIKLHFVTEAELGAK